jgi:hypothetical protein
MSYRHVTPKDRLVRLHRGEIVGWPYSLAAFLADHPGTWPDPMPITRLVDHGVHLVTAEPVPAGDPFAERLVVNPQPHLQVLGRYTAEQAAAKGTPERAGAPIIGSTWVLGWRSEPVPAREARAAANAAFLAWAERFLSQFTDGYPEAERLSWPIKEAAAEAWLDGIATTRQLRSLTREATTKGVPVEELATTIASKATLFREVIDFASGLRGRVQRQIATAQPDELQALLAVAEADARAMVAGLAVGQG